jgi:predicted Zn-dependent protease
MEFNLKSLLPALIFLIETVIFLAGCSESKPVTPSDEQNYLYLTDTIVKRDTIYEINDLVVPPETLNTIQRDSVFYLFDTLAFSNNDTTSVATGTVIEVELDTLTAQSLFISDADEEALGDVFHRQLLDSSQFTIFDPGTDPQRLALKSYLDSVFRTVYYTIPSNELPNYQKDFVLTIIDDDQVNAFSVPGGYVYINTGLIKALLDESELAGIMGHEMAHITRHHYRQTAVKLGIVSTIISAVEGGERTLGEFVRDSFGVLAGTYMSREHEEEADESGTEYLAVSYRNPRGIASFFSRMDGWHMPSVISTHPAPEDRVTAVNNQVDNNPDWAILDTEEKKYASKFQEHTAFLP